MRDFNPITPGEVGIYLCGATVQAPPHVGHLRPAVAFDVLRRWLTRRGLKVTLIRNVTDIDDKVLAKSAAAGREWWAHAALYERVFTQAYDALGAIPLTYGAARHRQRAGDGRAHGADWSRRATPTAPARATSGSTSIPGPPTGSSRARRSLPPAPRRAPRSWPAPRARPRRTRTTSRCGRPTSRASRSRRRGAPRTAEAARAGTWSAPRWPGATSASRSTSTVAASTCGSRTTRTSRPSPGRPATASRTVGCTSRGSRSPA